MPKKLTIDQVHAKLVDADAIGSRRLAEANDARERGKRALAEKLYDKGQYWLDRANKLRDQEFALKHQSS